MMLDRRPGGRRARYADAGRRLATAQKATAGVPAYLRFVNRRLGGRLAALSFAVGLRPSQVTSLSAVVTVGGLAVAVLWHPSLAVAVTATVLLLFGYALDSADGQLARVRGGGTPAGEWLDHVVDAPKTAALHLAVLAELVRFRGLDVRDAYVAVPVGFLLVSTTFFFGMMLRDQLIRTREPAHRGKGSVVRSFALLPFDYGTLCLSFVLLPWPDAFRWAYGLLFAATVAFAARGLCRTYRLLGSMAEPGR